MDMKAARYDLAVTGTGSAVQIKRQLKIDFVLMDQKFYAPLRSFFQTVKTSDEQQVGVGNRRGHSWKLRFKTFGFNRLPITEIIE
jgi:hypothetical protein